MNNYGHEIDCPDNRAICCFLWPGFFFHDSEITDFSFDQRMQALVMTLRSVWECEDYAHNQLKGSLDERRAALDERIEYFRYLLEFRGLAYFHMEADLTGLSDVYRGRFLDSALLRKISVESRRPLMHYRFEGSGYIDIVFTSFIIRKVKGRISYSAPVDCDSRACRPPHGIPDHILNGSVDRHLNQLLTAQRTRDTSALLRLARQSLDLIPETEQTCFYAAWLLGFLGDTSDLPALLSLYLSIDAHMMEHSLPINGRLPKRDVLDAIERIQWRAATGMPGNQG